MSAELIIYFVAMTILAGVFLALSIGFRGIETKDKKSNTTAAFLMIVFFIAFIVCVIIIAVSGYELSFQTASPYPLWLQEHWS